MEQDFKAEGWTVERGGKHQTKMTKPGQRPITLPENKRQAYSKGFEADFGGRPGSRCGAWVLNR